jgi:imidazolonepropionase-like amidohydrolase
VHTVGPAGTLQGGTVVIEDGIITAVGIDVRVPEDATIIDAGGAPVTPGLMNAFSYLGLMEVSGERSTVDVANRNEQFSAAFDVSYGLNPESVLIPVTRVKGITRTVSAPDAGDNIFAGQGAILALGEDGAFSVKPRAAQFMALGSWGARLAGGARGATWVFLRQAFTDALYFRENRRDFRDGETRETVLPPIDLEALLPVLDGSVPLAVWVHRASDIRQVIALSEDFDLRIILLGAQEAWKIADEIAEAGIAVVADARDNLPSSFESLAANFENVPKLAAAGVKVAFMASGNELPHNARNVTQIAGIAAANGLPWNDALAALTRYPAEMWGIADRYGTLEKGKAADVVVWSGDPLELASVPTRVFINGAAVDLNDTRQVLLRDRYRDLDSKEPPLGYRP